MRGPTVLVTNTNILLLSKTERQKKPKQPSPEWLNSFSSSKPKPKRDTTKTGATKRSRKEASADYRAKMKLDPVAWTVIILIPLLLHTLFTLIFE